MTTLAVYSREQLRTFHLSGYNPDDSIPAGTLHPALAGSLSELPDLECSYPLCIHPGGAAQSLRALLSQLEHAGNMTSAFRAAMGDETVMPTEDAAVDAIQSLTECSPAEIASLRKLLPDGSFLTAFHADSIVLLHAAALAKSRSARRMEFWNEIRRIAARLREILLLDAAHGPGAISPESISASLGSAVGAFFKPELLAKALERPPNPLRRMDPERRSRCETTLSILEEAIHEAGNQPDFWLFHSGTLHGNRAEIYLFRGEPKQVEDSFAAALAFCDARLDRLTQLLRAVRVARLEIESAFDPAVHEDMLARFDWQSATAAELLAIPAIVVLETADRVAQESLTSFGRLLRSGRPVQILIVRTGVNVRDLDEFSPDFAFQAIAHRECHVLQSSLAAPEHLLAGLASVASTLRPAVAVIAAPNSYSESDAWLEETLWIRSRALPLYSYDPEAGSRWADRFQLLPVANPPEGLSAVHAAALSPAFRSQFCTVPADAWSIDQMELQPYLDAYTTRPPLAIPYIWVDGPKGSRQRALVTRDLVNFCRDRRRAWALFEELAALAAPPPAAADQARQQGAREAIERVIALLGTP